MFCNYESDSKGAEEYAKKHVRTAMWMIQGLEQREQTLYRMIEAIAEELFNGAVNDRW
jgi:DNA-directed RNA polymerase specialized sigma54-like protein